jgi:hypothetical protein
MMVLPAVVALLFVSVVLTADAAPALAQGMPARKLLHTAHTAELVIGWGLTRATSRSGQT